MDGNYWRGYMVEKHDFKQLDPRHQIPGRKYVSVLLCDNIVQLLMQRIIYPSLFLQMVNSGHPNKVNKVCNGKLVTVSVIKSRDVRYSDSRLSQTESV